MSLILFFLLVLNFVISWFNAWSCGRGWAESRSIGGLCRFMAWCGAIMSACGFTWCYLVLLTLIDSALPLRYQLPAKYMDGMFNIGYLIIIIPVIGTGIAITMQSWAYFWKERTFKNGAVAGYNTFADIYNIYTAVRVVPGMISSLGELFKSDDEDEDLKSRLIGVMVLLAVLSVVGGIVTTTMIIRSTAKSVAVNEYSRANNTAYQAQAA